MKKKKMKTMPKPTHVTIESQNITWFMFLITETYCNIKKPCNFQYQYDHPHLLCHMNIEWRWFDIGLFFPMIN